MSGTDIRNSPSGELKPAGAGGVNVPAGQLDGTNVDPLVVGLTDAHGDELDIGVLTTGQFLRRNGTTIDTAAVTAGVSSFNTRMGAVLPATNDYTDLQVQNTSSVAGTGVKGALNTLLAAIGALVTGVSSVFGRSGAVTAQNNDYAVTQLGVSATAKLVGRFAAGAGLAQEGTIGGGLEVNAGLDSVQVATTLPARGSLNVTVDEWPSSQTPSTVINTGASITANVATAVGKSTDIAARVWVDDGANGACVFAQLQNVVAYQTGGAAAFVVNQTAWIFAAAGFTFAASLSGTNIVFTLTNTSGTNRHYSLEIGKVEQDK